MHPVSESARRPAPRRALWRLLSAICGAALVVGVGYVWLWREIQAQARACGVELTGCSIRLGVSSIRLLNCEFSLLEHVPRGDGTARAPWMLGDARVAGKVASVRLEFAGLQLESARVEGARVNVRGDPPWLAWLETANDWTSTRDSLPVDVVGSRLSWAENAEATPRLTLSEIRYEATARRLHAEFASSGAWHGNAFADNAGLNLTLGNPERPTARLGIRASAAGQRAELSLELHGLPLTELESSWLSVPPSLRSVALDGRIFAAIPFGLSSELPGGDLYLTLSGVQFPVPRELDGLVYGSAPKLSGKFNLTRSLARATFRDLAWLTGELEMHGDAQLERAAHGIGLQANLRGPLPCVAIADSAARAHPDSVLAQWAKPLASRSVSGAVEVVAVVQGNTAELAHAHVLTSIGVGCGLDPQPIAADLPHELLERLPDAIRRRPPRIEGLSGPRLPRMVDGLARERGKLLEERGAPRLR